jgi:hypothetical protein
VSVPNVNYVGVGKNGGGNSDLEQAKTEALQLANELTRAKLARLQGTLVERRVVQFVLSHVLATLREKFLQLPRLVASGLRGIDPNVVHNVSVRTDEVVRRSLEEASETLCKAVRAEDFLAAMNDDDFVVVESDAQKDSRERKKDAANEKRREEYQRRKRKT